MTRRPIARRTASAFAAASLLSLGLVGCGDDKDPGSAEDKEGTSAFGGIDEGDTVEAAEFVDTIAAGMEASTTATLTMTMTMGGEEGAITAEGAIDYTTDPPETAMTMDIDAGGEKMSADIRNVDGAIYMSMDELSEDGKFFKIDPDEPSFLSLLGLDQMVKQSDPLGSVEQLEPAIESVKYAGEEEVDGRDLHHYELTVDLAKYIEATEGEVPAEPSDEMPDAVTYDVWLDDEDRLGQVQLEFEMEGQELTMTMVADDWGSDVEIEAPPADQVEELPSMEEMFAELGES